MKKTGLLGRSGSEMVEIEGLKKTGLLGRSGAEEDWVVGDKWG